MNDPPIEITCDDNNVYLYIIEKCEFEEYSEKYIFHYIDLDIFVCSELSRGELTYDEIESFLKVKNMTIYSFISGDPYIWGDASKKFKDVYAENPECYHKCYLLFEDKNDYIKWKLSN